MPQSLDYPRFADHALDHLAFSLLRQLRLGTEVFVGYAATCGVLLSHRRPKMLIVTTEIKDDDEDIRDLMYLAAAQNVPAVFALNRKSIGKACGTDKARTVAVVTDVPVHLQRLAFKVMSRAYAVYSAHAKAAQLLLAQAPPTQSPVHYTVDSMTAEMSRIAV